MFFKSINHIILYIVISLHKMMLEFATFLLKEQSDPRIARILNTIDLHILVSLNPDGFEKRDGTCTWQAGRENANGVSFTLALTVCTYLPIMHYKERPEP